MLAADASKVRENVCGSDVRILDSKEATDLHNVPKGSLEFRVNAFWRKVHKRKLKEDRCSNVDFGKIYHNVDFVKIMWKCRPGQEVKHRNINLAKVLWNTDFFLSFFLLVCNNCWLFWGTEAVVVQVTYSLWQKFWYVLPPQCTLHSKILNPRYGQYVLNITGRRSSMAEKSHMLGEVRTKDHTHSQCTDQSAIALPFIFTIYLLINQLFKRRLKDKF